MIESSGWALPVVIVVLSLLAIVLAGLNHLEVSRSIAYAVGRAVVQLAIVSLALVWVLRSGWWTSAFIALMLLVAAFTAERRVSADGLWPAWTVVPILCGVTPVLVATLSAGVVPMKPEAVLPIAGIIIGGAMTGTTLSGRIGVRELHDRHGEYEAGLALGLPSRDSVLMLLRPQAVDALVPALDQTRTVGLVTLPGAFIGVLLGGGSPAQAGAAQIIVLVGIVCAQVIAVILTLELLAHRAEG